MAPVFAHGRLRLYLLRLLEEAPRHGYEVIRLLEERFQGLYAPSAGTVYPRLAKLEAERLVTHVTEGGRKVYSITDEGRAELGVRRGDLADLEREIRHSVAALAKGTASGGEQAGEERQRSRRDRFELARQTAASGGSAQGTGTRAPAPGADAAPSPTSDPVDAVRELERILDRFRDEVRDMARDGGVTQEQLREVRRLLSSSAAHIGAALGPRSG